MHLSRSWKKTPLVSLLLETMGRFDHKGAKVINILLPEYVELLTLATLTSYILKEGVKQCFLYFTKSNFTVNNTHDKFLV